MSCASTLKGCRTRASWASTSSRAMGRRMGCQVTKVLTGVFTLALVQNILTFAGVPGTWIDAVDGAIILAALVLARITSGKAQD